MAETIQTSVPAFDFDPRQSLTGNLVHFISNCGVMKAAVNAAMQAAR
jgi:hypothetical protein